MDITKEQIEKEANNFSYNKPIERFAFMAGAIWMQKEMEKRRCENCKYLKAHNECDQADRSELLSYDDFGECSGLIIQEPSIFGCSCWEAKNNDKE